MITDTLNRRVRFARPQPQGRTIELNDGDFRVFEAIDRHGHLPSNYLHLFKGGEKNSFQDRLTKLYNGTEECKPYLIRPPGQFDGFEARYQPIFYDLSQEAIDALKAQDSYHRYSPERSDHFLHRAMSACVTASLELTARGEGIRYIPLEEILSHEKCPEPTRGAANPLAMELPGHARTIVPDDLFGMQYQNGYYRFFALEVDRATESISRGDRSQTSFGAKLAAYLDILSSKIYQTHFGIPNLTVLTVTASHSRVDTMMEALGKLEHPQLHRKFGFQVDSHYGRPWSVPRDILRHLLLKPWRSREPFSIQSRQ